MAGDTLRTRTIVLLSIVFTLIVNFPALVSRNSDSLQQFTDIDEPYYFSRALSIGAGKPLEFYYLEERTKQIDLVEHIVHDLRGAPEFFLGAIANKLRLDAPTFGLVLDLIISPIAFICWGYFFGALLGNLRIGLLVSAVTMVLPWVFSLGSYVSLHSEFLERTGFYSDYFTVESLSRFPAVPLLRGISTQLTYPLVGLSLWLILLCSKGEKAQTNRVILAGVCTSALLYIYIFAFGATFLLGAWLLLFPILNGRFRITFMHLGIFGVTNLICITPFLVAIASERNAAKYTLPEIADYYFLPPILIVQSLVAIALCLRSNRNPTICKLLWVYTGSCLVEIPLANIQPITRVALSPYHFGELYLHPITSGVTMLLLWAASVRLRPVRYVVSWILFSLILTSVLLPIMSAPRIGPQPFEIYQEVYEYLNTALPKDAVVAFPPVPNSFKGEIPNTFSTYAAPVLLSSMTGRALLYQQWAPTFTKDSLKRELLMGWLYTGQLIYAWGCPTEVTLPGDLFTLTWTVIKLIRKQSCSQMEELQRTSSPCALLRAYKVDYLAWNKVSGAPIPIHGREVWRDSNDGLRLYSVDQQSLLDTECRSN
jgi:hypothetical protein